MAASAVEPLKRNRTVEGSVAGFLASLVMAGW